MEEAFGRDGAAGLLHPQPRVAEHHHQVWRVATKRLARQRGLDVRKRSAEHFERVFIVLVHDVPDNGGGEEEVERKHAQLPTLRLRLHPLRVDERERAALGPRQEGALLARRQDAEPAAERAGAEGGVLD